VSALKEYFDIDGYPVRWLMDSTPETYVNGKWIPYRDTRKIMEDATVLTKEQLDALVAEHAAEYAKAKG
jgi:hypothetical protein